MFEEQIINFFGEWGVFAVVIICACMPLVDSKIAIPLGCATAVWGSSAMTVWGATLVSFLASTVAGILVVLLLTPIFNRLKKKKLGKYVVQIESFLEKKMKFFNRPNKKKQVKNTKAKTMALLITFYALPLPVFGIYSGAGLSVLLNLKVWQRILCLVVGNLLNCLLVATLCVLFYSFVPLILATLIIILILVLLWYLINFLYGIHFKRKQKKA